MKNSAVLGLAAALCFSGACFASETEASGFYLGIDAGKVSQPGRYGDDLIGNVAVGYNFNDRVSAELFARNLSFVGRMIISLFDNPEYHPSAHAGVAVLGTFPVSTSFRLIGRLGVGSTEIEGNRANMPNRYLLDTSAGLGLGYQISDHTLIQISSTYFKRADVATHLVGFKFSF